MKCKPVYKHDERTCIQCAVCGADGTREDLSQNECKGRSRQIVGELVLYCPRYENIFEMGEVCATVCSHKLKCEFYAGRIGDTITCRWRDGVENE